MREATADRAQEHETRAECPDHVLLRVEAIDAVDSDRIERARRARLRLEPDPIGYTIDDE